MEPSEALRELLAGPGTLKPALVIFAVYTAGSAAAAVFLPPSFMPEAPAATFGQPAYVYLLAGLFSGLAMNVLCAALLPRLSDLFAAGRIGPRVLLSLAAALAYLAALAVLKRHPAALALFALLPAAAAWRGYQLAGARCSSLLRVLLAAGAIGTVFLPLDGLSIFFSLRQLYEVSAAAMSLWCLVFLVKALRLSGGPSAPRTVSAVFFALAVSALFLYNVSLLLPERLQPLMILF